MVDSPYLSWYLHYADKACKCGWSCLQMKKPSVSRCQQLKTANSDVFHSAWDCFWYHIWCLDTKKTPWLDTLVPQKWPAITIDHWTILTSWPSYHQWTILTSWPMHMSIQKRIHLQTAHVIFTLWSRWYHSWIHLWTTTCIYLYIGIGIRYRFRYSYRCTHMSACMYM